VVVAVASCGRHSDGWQLFECLLRAQFEVGSFAAVDRPDLCGDEIDCPERLLFSVVTLLVADGTLFSKSSVRT